MHPVRPARVTLLVIVATLSLLVAACGSGGSGGKAAEPAVSGAFGQPPKVTVPKAKPPSKTTVTVLHRGTGKQLQRGDLAVVNGYGRTWKSDTAFEDTFGSGTLPDTLPIGSGQLSMSGLDTALVDVPTGSRVLVVVPPAQGFGEVASAGATLPKGVDKSDTAVLVFDVLDGYAGDAGPSGTTVSSGGGDLPTVSAADPNTKPTIEIPKVAAPTKLSVTTLIRGDGPAVTKGQELVVQYVGEIWASGKEFDSSWKRGQPAAFPVGAGQLIAAWDTGLIGVHVGSRVMIVAPPGDAYGAAGQPSAGISGTDTLVFVVDVLGAYGG